MAKGYSLKLQINERGAWRNVLAFEPSERTAVEVSAITQARSANYPNSKSSVTWRITGDGRSALAYLEAPYTAWRTA